MYFKRRNWAVGDHKTLVQHVIRLLQAYPVIILSILPCNHLKTGPISWNRIFQSSHDLPSVTSCRTKCQLSGYWTGWILWPMKSKKGFPCLKTEEILWTVCSCALILSVSLLYLKIMSMFNTILSPLVKHIYINWKGTDKRDLLHSN